MELEDLKNTKIKSIKRTPEGDIMLFSLYTQCYILHAEGDCCSKSWFEHMDNVDALKSATIKSVEEIRLEEVNVSADEYIKTYSIKFVTNKGLCTLEMRNSSNGYYGGMVQVSLIDNQEAVDILSNACPSIESDF